MCGSGVEVLGRGVAMRAFGPRQRLEGVQPRTLNTLETGRDTRCQFGSALLQLAGTSARRLAAGSSSVPA
jgi:hypothetical protein